MSNPVLSVIVPLYNEQEVIKETSRRLTETLNLTGESWEIIFVDDGSSDSTNALAHEICSADNRFRLITFSRNFGHQCAITAGMERAFGQAVVVIDADLQDPPEVILEMLSRWREGYQVVYGRRVSREGESIFKKLTAKLFYRGLDSLSGVKMPVDAGDFRLLDRQVVDTLKQLPEHNRYVRGLVSWVGYKQTAVDYVRQPRFAGETKYPLKKMLRLAGDGVVGFSSKPLTLPLWIGGFMSIIGFIYLIALCVRAVFFTAPPGWSFVLSAVILLFGLNLVFLGIIGGYLSRVVDETRSRPLFIVSEEEGFPKND